ncbi:MAG: hypothetical protein ABIR34_06575 [Marmoricola sp.]
MNSTRLNPLAEDYLGRLEAAARVLPNQDREDLLLELRGHLEAGLAEDASDADVRNLLNDLGSPEEIVAAAALESEAGPPIQRPREHLGAFDESASPWGTFEVLAVLGLTVGTVLIPIVGPVLGLGFAWASPQWTRREKWFATVLTFLPVIALVLGAGVAMNQGPSRPVSNAPLSHLIIGVLS